MEMRAATIASTHAFQRRWRGCTGEVPCVHAAASADVGSIKKKLLQMGHLTEELKAGINFLAGKRKQALCAEALHGKAAHHASVEHSALEDIGRDFSLRGNVSQEAAGERVPGAGGVAHFIQRQRRDAKRMSAKTECSLLKKDSRAIFAMLDDQGLRPERENLVRRTQQVVVFSKLAGFAIVDDHDVNIADGLRKLLWRGINPKWMCIQTHEFRAVHLLPHFALQPGINVA